MCFRLKGAREELNIVMAQLKEKQDKLASIEAKVQSILIQYSTVAY